MEHDQNTIEKQQPHLMLLKGRNETHLEQLIKDGIKVDAVVMDPPYCSGGSTTAARAKGMIKYIKSLKHHVNLVEFGDEMDQISYGASLLNLLLKFEELLKPPGYVFIFSDWRQIAINPIVLQMSSIRFRGVIPWNKKNCRPNKGVFKNQCEFVVWGTLDGTTPNKYADGYFEQSPPQMKDRYHATEKPVELLEHLLRILPDGARTVCDPFMGGGSTGEACARLGLDFIGIEKNEIYFNTCKERLEPLFANCQEVMHEKNNN